MSKKCSKHHGCEGKINLGRKYRKSADKLAAKHGKVFGVYQCPWCGGTHLTTKLDYDSSLLYVTGENIMPRKIKMVNVTLCEECSIGLQGFAEQCFNKPDETGETGTIIIKGKKGCGAVYSKEVE
jgi:hypothetical protein